MREKTHCRFFSLYRVIPPHQSLLHIIITSIIHTYIKVLSIKSNIIFFLIFHFRGSFSLQIISSVYSSFSSFPPSSFLLACMLTLVSLHCFFVLLEFRFFYLLQYFPTATFYEKLQFCGMMEGSASRKPRSHLLVYKNVNAFPNNNASAQLHNLICTKVHIQLI